MTAATRPWNSGDRLVLAPDVNVRFWRGQYLIELATSRSSVFRTTERGLLTWIMGFSRPLDPEQAVGTATLAERESALNLIGSLHSMGLLRVVQAETVDNPPDYEQWHKHSLSVVPQLAQAVFALGADLHGMGPYAQARLHGESGTVLAQRLQNLQRGFDELRTDLAAIRAEHIDRQLQRLGISRGSDGLKLHIGSGGSNIPGWVNIDVYPAPLAMNLDWGLPFADGSVRCVFLAHLLEHLFYPGQALRLLAEIRRVLAPDGVVRIVVPDIEQCLKAYVDNDREFFDSRRKSWTWWPESQTRLEDFLAYAGAGPNPAYLLQSHKFGYDYETLSQALRRSGFVEVIRSGFMESVHAELKIDDASVAAGARHGEHSYSLFVEARAAAKSLPVSAPPPQAS